jgi:hypothetical protein
LRPSGADRAARTSAGRGTGSGNAARSPGTGGPRLVIIKADSILPFQRRHGCASREKNTRAHALRLIRKARIGTAYLSRHVTH